MKSTQVRKFPVPNGFALVITLSLMILLVVIAVGLLSLSTISIRANGSESASHVAKANARLALMLALGELQKAAGDDRRITADGSIYDGSANPNVVGVWKSWSPNLASNPIQTTTQPYASKKTSNFVTWLTSSGNPTDLAAPGWAKSATLANPVSLFTLKSDGFVLAGEKVDLLKGKPSAGAMAWSVVQDATRAKINVGGPERAGSLNPNDNLQAQARPSLSKSDNFNQPAGDWNQRAGRVISMAQAKLDSNLWKGTTVTPENADFTSQGLGLLTDVVNGGLKTDLSLGFEMSDAEFAKPTWGNFKNPFRYTSVTAFPVKSAYRGQRPLFRPLTDFGSVKVDLSFDVASTSFEMPAAIVPTFDTLRSFYRTPYYLYNTADGPTVFERGMDHVALKQASPSGSVYSPSATPPGQFSRTSYRPVLDRVLYLLSIGLGADKEVRLVFTPIVTLWNPYNVALEIEGAVAYPWMDIPFDAKWRFYKNGVAETERGWGLSRIMGSQFISVGHGRTVNPYFFASITPDGSGTVGSNQSIRFKPGEVRVFAPTSTTVVDYRSNASIRQRTVYLGPVNNIAQLSTKGGIAVPMQNPARTEYGFKRPMTPGDSVEVTVSPNTSNNDFPFCFGLQDASLAKAPNPGDGNRGQTICDVQTATYGLSGVTATISSARYSYSEFEATASEKKPFGLIETYHRTANDPIATRRSDLVFTVNPRQAFVNRYLIDGTFQAGPHYETLTRAISSLGEFFQTDDGGRTAFYGAGSGPGAGGLTKLSFFEVPQEPLLSLAAFQHADLSGTAYSPGNQVGNSWASAYLGKNLSGRMLPAANAVGSGELKYTCPTLPVVDYSYLANEALWDSYYFSGAAPSIQPGSATGNPNMWLGSGVANVSTGYKETLEKFIEDPLKNPLKNPRMRFSAGNESLADLKADLVKSEGCLKLAGHLYMDGAFNINSTSRKAWIAFLSGMRDVSFSVRNGSPPSGGKTAFPRFRNPIGNDDNKWMGFRSLTDTQIAELADKIIIQVKSRGPFLSLGEFVNRRIDNTTLALTGTIQAAIDATQTNNATLYADIDTTRYASPGKANILPKKTGVGIPGYLTQADVLQSIAPVMTARSDTFTIRGYGEAKDSSGKVLAIARCEAVVQRTAEFVDPANPSYTPYLPATELRAVNQTFGRKFSIVSFRYLAKNELIPDSI